MVRVRRERPLLTGVALTPFNQSAFGKTIMKAIFLLILAITLARGQDDRSGEDRPLGGILGGHESDDINDPDRPPLGGIIGGHESEDIDDPDRPPLGGIVGGHESENKTQDQPLGGILGSNHGSKTNGNKARRPLGGLEG